VILSSFVVLYFGNLLFTGPIFNAINPSGSLLENNLYILLNNAIALFGLYLAVSLVGRVGLLRLQAVGFLLSGCFFLITGIFYLTFSPNALLTVYMLSTFFGQCGPNLTTYVSAATVYPTAARTTLHGFSAFTGKTGALIATIVFGSIDVRTIFYISAGALFVGSLITVCFGVDFTTLTMEDLDREYEAVIRRWEYHGIVCKATYVSLFDKMRGEGHS